MEKCTRINKNFKTLSTIEFYEPSPLLACSINGYRLKTALETKIEVNMRRSMENYKREGYEEFSRAWDLLQSDLECCGVNGYSDWIDSQETIPSSCFKQV